MRNGGTTKLLSEKLKNEWHPTKNEGIDLNKVTPGSGKRVWWVCCKGHEWEAVVAYRNQGRGCPYCAGKRVSVDNCLATVKPEVVKEWHPNKNGELTPNDVTYGSKKKVWWKCQLGHEWETRINDRTSNKGGCPYCSRHRISELNALSGRYPELINEWHPTKNVLSPNEIAYSSNEKVWWQCSKGHEWESSPNNRTRKGRRGCPYCSSNKVGKDNCLANLFPHLISEWNYSKNKGIGPYDVTAYTGTKVWWKCKLGHEWKAAVSSRAGLGSNCPKCFNKTSFGEQAIYFYLNKVFNYAESRKIFAFDGAKIEVDIFIPELNLAIEYDGEYFHRNKLRKEIDKINVLRENNLEIINMREKGLESVNFLEIIIGNRKLELAIKELLELINELFELNKVIDIKVDRDRNEILNSYIFLEKQNSVAMLFPDVAEEWNYSKNGSLSPYNFSKSSGQSVWWKCNLGHEWKAIISDRTRGNGCPYCSGRRVCIDNCLATIRPELTLEWHPQKNKKTPYDFTSHSGRKVWWKCNKGHEWEEKIANRTNGYGCPYCKGKRVSIDNCLATIKPDLIKEWHYIKNKISPYDVTVGSNKKIWWICEKGHEWETKILYRTNGSNCPYCSNKKVCLENCLATIKPSLVKEWHSIKNKELTPYDVTFGSGKKVWWKCKMGHEWEAQVAKRSNGRGCPNCANVKRVINLNSMNE